MTTFGAGIPLGAPETVTVISPPNPPWRTISPRNRTVISAFGVRAARTTGSVRGTISSDRFAASLSTGLNDVARYPLYPGIHSMPSMQFTINKAKWDELSEDG